MVVMRTVKERNFWMGNVRPIMGLVLLLLFAPVLFIAGRQAVELLSHAAPIPANILVNAASMQGALSRPWEGLSQGGEQEYPGKLVTIGPVTGQVRALGTRYIRVDHVLEEPFYGSLRFRIKEITAAGAIPFVALSYFPRGVANSDVGTVQNWNLWQTRVKEAVELISGRNQMNIAGVYYEVWNEPDGSGFGGFNIGTGKDYFVLYQKTVEAINSAQNVNSFKVGGPALADLRRCTNGGLFVCNQYWLDRFLGLVARSHLRLDFISWHKYATRLSDYNEDVNFIISLYNKYPAMPPVEKIITEWGSDPARNGIHNTNFDAAHLVAAARAFIGHVDLTTRFEVRDGPDSGEKGWGIMYFNGVKKPTFEALKMLGLLRENRILLSGEGTSVTGIASRDGSGATVVLANYDSGSRNTENVPVRIMNLTPGSYRLTKEILSSLYPLGKKETSSFVTSDGSWNSVELMTPNSVVLYDFQLFSLLTSGN